jgi:ATP-dependent DNA ligase
MSSDQRQGRPCDSCLAPRSQVRRLPPDGSAREKPRAPVQPQRTRLDRSLSLDRRVRAEEPASQFVIDGEAVILGVDGIADFDALHSRQHEEEVQLYAFDVLALDGDDLRRLPLSMRKTNLAQLLRGRPDGIFAAPFEQGEIGPDLFRAACNMGLEGMVSKRTDRPYRAGRSPDWVKVKNWKHPAFDRVQKAHRRA